MFYFYEGSSIKDIREYSLEGLLELKENKNRLKGICDHEVFIKTGNKTRVHLSHYPKNSECKYSANIGKESEEHLLWKKLIYMAAHHLKDWDIEIEKRLKGKAIADIFAVNKITGERVVIEYQKTYQSLLKLEKRTRIRKLFADRVIWITSNKYMQRHYSNEHELYYSNPETFKVKAFEKDYFSNIRQYAFIDIQYFIPLLLEGKTRDGNKASPYFFYKVKDTIITIESEPVKVRSAFTKKFLNGDIYKVRAHIYQYKPEKNHFYQQDLFFPRRIFRDLPKIGEKYWGSNVLLEKTPHHFIIKGSRGQAQKIKDSSS